jgi:hypothetical protein
MALEAIAMEGPEARVSDHVARLIATCSCNGLQSKRAGTAISAFLGPHYLPLSPYSRPQYLPLRLQSSVSDCNQRSQDHIICH